MRKAFFLPILIMLAASVLAGSITGADKVGSTEYVNYGDTVTLNVQGLQPPSAGGLASCSYVNWYIKKSGGSYSDLAKTEGTSTISTPMYYYDWTPTAESRTAGDYYIKAVCGLNPASFVESNVIKIGNFYMGSRDFTGTTSTTYDVSCSGGSSCSTSQTSKYNCRSNSESDSDFISGQNNNRIVSVDLPSDCKGWWGIFSMLSCKSSDSKGELLCQYDPVDTSGTIRTTDFIFTAITKADGSITMTSSESFVARAECTGQATSDTYDSGWDSASYSHSFKITTPQEDTYDCILKGAAGSTDYIGVDKYYATKDVSFDVVTAPTIALAMESYNFYEHTAKDGASFSWKTNQSAIGRVDCRDTQSGVKTSTNWRTTPTKGHGFSLTLAKGNKYTCSMISAISELHYSAGITTAIVSQSASIDLTTTTTEPEPEPDPEEPDEPEPTVESVCKDTDGGNKPNVAGFVFFSDKPSVRYTDKCEWQRGWYQTEYYCENNELKTWGDECDNDCYAGECLPKLAITFNAADDLYVPLINYAQGTYDAQFSWKTNVPSNAKVVCKNTATMQTYSAQDLTTYTTSHRGSNKLKITNIPSGSYDCTLTSQGQPTFMSDGKTYHSDSATATHSFKTLSVETPSVTSITPVAGTYGGGYHKFVSASCKGISPSGGYVFIDMDAGYDSSWTPFIKGINDKSVLSGAGRLFDITPVKGNDVSLRCRVGIDLPGGTKEISDWYYAKSDGTLTKDATKAAKLKIDSTAPTITVKSATVNSMNIVDVAITTNEPTTASITCSDVNVFSNTLKTTHNFRLSVPRQVNAQGQTIGDVKCRVKATDDYWNSADKTGITAEETGGISGPSGTVSTGISTTGAAAPGTSVGSRTTSTKFMFGFKSTDLRTKFGFQPDEERGDIFTQYWMFIASVLGEDF